MIQPIFGEYNIDKNRIILCVLTLKTYSNSIIEIINKTNNKSYQIKLNIIKYSNNKVVLNSIKIGSIYDITIKDYNSNILSKSNLNLMTNPFDNVYIVNCDSTWGFETNTWNKLENMSKNQTNVIFHIGDQTYNDFLFFKTFYKLEYNNEIIEDKSINKKIYEEYFTNFSRDKKSNILSANINIMIPDEHEIVDDTFITANSNNKNFLQVYKIFEKFVRKFAIDLRFEYNGEDISFITDDKNNTIYVLNYGNVKYDEKIDDNFQVYNNVKLYKNVVFLERKVILSGHLNNIGKNFYDNNITNFDYLIKMINKLGKKNINIICGDSHQKYNFELKIQNKKIALIKTIGAINSSQDYFDGNYKLDSNILDATCIQTYYNNSNGFLKIVYEDNTLKTLDIVNSKNIPYKLLNFTYVGTKIIYNRYIKKLVLKIGLD